MQPTELLFGGNGWKHEHVRECPLSGFVVHNNPEHIAAWNRRVVAPAVVVALAVKELFEHYRSCSLVDKELSDE
jgi:hypothetical protein